MNITKIDDEFSVSPQITSADVAAIAAQGFKSIICNRPDGEEAGQPAFAVIEKAAQEAGLEIRYLPISHSGLSASSLAEIEAAFDTLPKPVLGYCRSGARSNMAWQACAA